MSNTTATSDEVLAYYARNWEQITRCYDLGADGLPLDPAYYRRLLYLRILRETKADRILDIGCGGGRTVLDALEMGRKVHGIEPTAELFKAARQLLLSSGHNSEVIAQEDMLNLRHWKPSSFGAVSVLSVLPHVSEEDRDAVHEMLANLIEGDGYFIASYRNDLFDLFTFNSFSVDFVVNVLLDNIPCGDMDRSQIQEHVESLLKYPRVPSREFTAAKDKTFGFLTRENSNPLTIGSYLSRFGLRQLQISFFNFHCVPPLIADKVAGYRQMSHAMNLGLANDWRGNFMASTFIVLAKKVAQSN